MMRASQCSQMGAMRWIAQEKESKTCLDPSRVSTEKARSYSFPQTSQRAMRRIVRSGTAGGKRPAGGSAGLHPPGAY